MVPDKSFDVAWVAMSDDTLYKGIMDDVRRFKLSRQKKQLENYVRNRDQIKEGRQLVQSTIANRNLPPPTPEPPEEDDEDDFGDFDDDDDDDDFPPEAPFHSTEEIEELESENDGLDNDGDGVVDGDPEDDEDGDGVADDSTHSSVREDLKSKIEAKRREADVAREGNASGVTTQMPTMTVYAGTTKDKLRGNSPHNNLFNVGEEVDEVTIEEAQEKEAQGKGIIDDGVLHLFHEGLTPQMVGKDPTESTRYSGQVMIILQTPHSYSRIPLQTPFPILKRLL